MARSLRTAAPERLELEQRTRIQYWAEQHARGYLPHLGRLWASCRDWHRANGKQRVDWEATFRNWIRVQQRLDVKVSGPRRAASSGVGLEKLGDLLKKEGL